jgi:hypothetical protein
VLFQIRNGKDQQIAYAIRHLTSPPPLKQIVLRFFNFAEITARGSKIYQIGGFILVFFAKSIGENRNRLAIVVWIYLKKTTGG